MARGQNTDEDPDEAAQRREPFVAFPVLSAPRPVPAPSPGAGTAPPASAERPVAAGPRSRVGASDFGPLARYVSDPAVTDIFVNGPDDLWIDRGAGLVRQSEWSCPSEARLRELAVAIVACGGRHIDEATPCADVRLHDGIRVHAALPPIAPKGTLLSIRIPPLDRPKLDSLAASGLFGDGAEAESARAFIDEAVRDRANLLITGAGGSGKTTLLSALLAAADAADRIIAVEDVAELRVQHPHFIALETRQPNLEGAGGVGLDRLLREALRMRPDRLVLGECRGGEIRELLSALNTGHDGGAGTLHANSLDDVPARLEALGSLAAMSPETVARQAVSAIGLVLHLERRGANRRLDAVGRFGIDSAGRLRIDSVS
ncbi:TadA family conjugal transfer-associated ATPase [Agreia sp.]|uniref:TadA family conjugal transfer-associated ATPase n=1 Tax=Agreia sp. TaxID=1872416 RepID=UPI0035BC17AF